MPSPTVATITLGGKPVYQDDSHVAPVNFFMAHSGAQNYGIGLFLMLRSDYDALVSSNPNSVRLNMLDGNGGSIGINVQIRAAIPHSLSKTDDATNDQNPSDMVQVMVFDLRCQFLSPIQYSFNVQQQGFPYSGSTPLYYHSTLNTGSEYSWADVVTQLEFPALPSPPAWKPRNLIWDNVASAAVADDIAGRLFYVVGWDYGTDKITFNFPGAATSANSTMLGNAAKYRIDGGSDERNLASLPGKIRVSFQSSTDNPFDPFLNRVYVKDVTNGVGLASVTQALHVGGYIAIYASSSLQNGTELDAVATDMAGRAQSFLQASRKEATFAGLFPFVLDGSVRGILWQSDKNGATTTVRLDDDTDFDAMRDLRRTMQLLSNQLVIGLGTTNTDVTPVGTRYVWTTAAAGGVTVKITANRSYCGKYDGTIYGGTTTDDGTNDLTMPDGLTAGASCLIVNLDEDLSSGDASATHRLKLNTYITGVLIGMSLEGTPRPVIAVHGGIGRQDSPTVLTNGGYGSPDTNKWRRANDGTPLTLTVMTNWGFDAGSGNLFFHTRPILVDARGMWYETDGETETTIDTANCPGGSSGGSSPSFAGGF